MEWIAYYVLGILASGAFFVFLDRATEHYGYGSNQDDRAASIVGRALVWPIGLPATLLGVLFGMIEVGVKKLLR